MIFPVEIINPFSDKYGAKISFTLPQNVDRIKTIALKMNYVNQFQGLIAETNTDPNFYLINFSLLLNNETEQVFSNTNGQVSLFDVGTGLWLDRGQPKWMQSETYNNGKIHINKSIIKNSVHHAIFSMTQEMIDFVNSVATPKLYNYVKNKLRLTLYVEA